MVIEKRLLFREESEGESRKIVGGKSKIKKSRSPGVRCLRCQFVIADNLYRYLIDEKYRHTFVNPVGQIFEVVTISKGKGIVSIGDKTLDNTWFDGFMWNYAHCSKCSAQLGWSYYSLDQRETVSFFGLIFDNIGVNEK